MPAARHYTTYTKEEVRNSTAIIANQKTLEGVVYLSKVKFDDNDDPNSYITCEHCGYRAAQIDQHLKKWHNQSVQEYQEQFPDAPLVCKNAQERVKGDKNPGYQHGGKLSAYSSNFVKYQDKTPEEIAKEKQEVIDKANQTRQDNPERQPTRIEYYLAQGMTEDEARIALSKRQSTFSLDKCIEAFGEDIGHIVWESRQNKWQDTLNSKPLDERIEINRRKVPKIIHSGLWSKVSTKSGIFYVIKIADNLYKFGMTSKSSIKERYQSVSQNSYSIINEIHVDKLMRAFRLEKVVQNEFKEYAIGKHEEISRFGYTEVLRMNGEEFQSFTKRISELMQMDDVTLGEHFDNCVFHLINHKTAKYLTGNNVSF